ncbi:hypothetical protein [Pseudomonas japonica]|uniref:PLD-like domain-containing protein n=1 Tax=Pseudomonas japonica TaxID=256466 RepID=A0A239KT85_9PSED|nr:hypothetical protein [Pseudomonas japonica]SNT21577.1 hypothetical protein SAMN05444352_12928 [Pseudomonas japonica]
MKLHSAFAEQVKACGRLRRVWLSSFNIDIEFIETYVLPTVLGAEIPRTRMDYEALQLTLTEQNIDLRVFCDRRFMGADQVKRTALQVHGVCTAPKPGWNYPGVGEDSLLHAKVIYLEGEQGRVLGAGSANLTLSGWARNQEVFHFQPIDAFSLYQSARVFFQALFENIGIPCPLENRRRSSFASEESSVRFCHSFQRQTFLAQLLDGRACHHLAVWSPYLPRDLAQFVCHLKSSCDQPRMKISLVPDRLDGLFLRTAWSEALGDLFANDELRLRHPPRKADDRSPMTHAKLWKTSSHLAIGSWNFTRAGSNSLTDSRGGRLPGNNIEAGFILASNRAVESVLGLPMDTSPASFLSDEALQEQALHIPQNLPFDIVVTFDWKQQAYQLRGQWHAAEAPDQGYRVKLPDIDAAIALAWKPRSRELRACGVAVANVHALLSDHSFQVLKDDRVCFVGMLLESNVELRRTQRYDDLSALVDAMAHIDIVPNQDDVDFRVRESAEGELQIDGAGVDEDTGAREQEASAAAPISYFRLFTASYQFAARLRGFNCLSALEQWVFVRPGCLQEWVDKTRQRLRGPAPNVFDWFLAREVNGLCRLALALRHRLPKKEGKIALSRWQALKVDMPPLPAEASDAYRQTIEREFGGLESKWGDA